MGNPAASGISGLQKQISPIIEKAQSLSMDGYRAFRALLDRYPPIKVFLVVLALFSAIPLAIFVGVSMASGTVVFATAGTGIALVQGSIMAFGGFILSFWLVGALIFAGLATSWFVAGYFGIKAAKKLAA